VGFAITRIDSKWRVVLPREMRKGLRTGDKLLLIKDTKRIVIKPFKELDKRAREDLEFAVRTEEAYKRHERGEFITMEWDEFMKEFK
jgi:bifunctional DNA-binding transcriptional regulator/antitoxin component of YhaV-PrlF toxin-antitoxin module